MASLIQGIDKKAVLKYTLLPGIFPRFARLSRSGFYMLATLMASVFAGLRILPSTHPYLHPAMSGKFGVVQVIAQAANHVKFERQNWDKVAVFFAVLTGLVLLAVQFLIMVVSFVISPARAAGAMPDTYAGFFVTENHETDLAFRALDMVFGIPDLFNSQEMSAGGGSTPMNLALQALFEFYSLGLLFVGIFIILYFIFTIVAETAQTGIPFGKRFSHVWAPVRLIAFFALLIPITSGLNGAQILTLYAAKWGSGLATNSWLAFNEVLLEARHSTDVNIGSSGAGPEGGSETTLTGDRGDQIFAEPNVPELAYLPSFMMIARTCHYTEKLSYEGAHVDDPQSGNGRNIQAYVVAGSDYIPLEGANLQSILEQTGGAKVHIRFGAEDTGENAREGFIYPYCGELSLPVNNIAEPGVAHIQNEYFKLIQDMWTGGLGDIDTHARQFNLRFNEGASDNDPRAETPGSEEFTEMANETLRRIIDAIPEAIRLQVENGALNPDDKMKEYGWGGAAIWYNEIAKQNGALTDVIQNPPVIVRMPQVMEENRRAKMRTDFNLTPENQYSPDVRQGASEDAEELAAYYKSVVLNEVYQLYMRSGFRSDGLSHHTSLTGNLFIDTVNLLFGTQGLFDMCKNVDKHPLAQLSTLGKSLIENAIRSLGLGILAGAAGGLASIIDGFQTLAPAGFKFAGFFISVMSIALMAGFILFYILPFMPFIYFFFAFSDWIKGLFEAMVGLPLWALAHLRIDGDGLSGEAASGGYFLIFEIFIRPVMIIVGFIAALTIFAAMVRVMNEIFYLLVGNMAGHNPDADMTCFTDPQNAGSETGGSAEDDSRQDPALFFRGPVDEFFYTIIYTIFVYMIGTASFKLIDAIPDNILRWMNAGVSGFSDKSGDPAEGLVKYAAIGGGGVASKIAGGFSGAGSNLMGAVNSLRS